VTGIEQAAVGTVGLGLGTIEFRAGAGLDVDDEGGGVEGMRDIAHVNIREGRDGGEEGSIVAVISASGSALERELW
jgi:hypothetical protein